MARYERRVYRRKEPILGYILENDKKKGIQAVKG